MYNNINKYYLLSIIIGILSGCNGSSSDSSDDHSVPPKKEISIYTQDTIQFRDGKKPIVVDLRNKIKSENNEAVIISDVKSLDPDDKNCMISDINGLTFTTTTKDIGICRYKYKVKPVSSSSEGQGQAISQIIVTADYDKGEYVPPVSSTTPASSETEPSIIQFDKSIIQIPDGFKFNDVDLIGDTESHELGSVSFNNESITYISPVDTTGVVRIYYSIVNEESNIIRPGIIYIAIGQSINSNPIAEPESKIASMSILDDKRSPVDVAPYTSDPDEDPLQLISVYSSQGIVKDINGLKFTYIPTETGTNYITYIVSDHNGGYAVGTLISEVSSFINIYDENQDVTFIAPLTNADLNATQGISSGEYQEFGDTGPEGSYPVFDSNLALSYCTTRGLVLPTKEQYVNLFNNKLKKTPIFDSDYKWIAGAPYVAIDGFISLASGESSEADVGYFSCVKYVAPPTEYSFSRSSYLGEFDENVLISVSANTIYGLFPLPEELYALEAEVDHTTPAGLEDKVSVFVSGQTVRVSIDPSIEDEIKNVIVTVKDPEHVQGTISETKIIYGITTCQRDATVEDMQTSDCVPILSYIGSPVEITALVRDETLANMGVNISEMPSIFQPVTNSPVYSATDSASYLESEKADKLRNEWRDKGREFVQQYCDILSDLYIGGRNNWQAKFPDGYNPDDEPGWKQDGFNKALTASPRRIDSIKALRQALWRDSIMPDSKLPHFYIPAATYGAHNRQFNIVNPVGGGLAYQDWWESQGLACVSMKY